MANVGSGASGNTYIGTGNGKSGTYVPIGTLSGLTDHGVVIAQGNGAFVASSPGTAGQILTSNGASADPTFQAAPSGGIVTIDGDTGSITGSTVTIYANQATQQAGATVAFVNSGTTSTFEVTDTSHNTLIGKFSGNSSLSGIRNTALGDSALFALTGGNENVSVGASSLAALTTGFNNSCLGYGAFGYITSGSQNIGIGDGAGYLCKNGNESGNIYLGHYGVNGESNAMRLGLDGVTSTAYMSGVNGVTVSNQLMVVMDSATEQMGTAPIPTSPNPNQVITLVDDFTSWYFESAFLFEVQSVYPWLTDSLYPFSGVASPIGGYPGLITNPSIGAAGISYLYMGQGGQNPAFILGFGAITVEWVFNIITPPDGTNDYFITCGMIDSVSGGLNWLIFQAHFGQNWQLINSFNASTTTTDSGISITTGWHKFSISVDAIRSTATYSLDGNIFTISPDIPTLAISPVFRLLQNSGTVPAGSVVVDLFTLTQTLTTSR